VIGSFRPISHAIADFSGLDAPGEEAFFRARTHHAGAGHNGTGMVRGSLVPPEKTWCSGLPAVPMPHVACEEAFWLDPSRRPGVTYGDSRRGA